MYERSIDDTHIGEWYLIGDGFIEQYFLLPSIIYLDDLIISVDKIEKLIREISTMLIRENCTYFAYHTIRDIDEASDILHYE